ncbi:HEAT repeat domain-containing protein [Actinophytocola sp.]|uniref:HEAT repeat domain-containing protein n=1 Tax=Actinophytocola sp. TaxID=1872138 RepID=UPI002ED1C207
MSSRILVLDIPPGDASVLERLSPALNAIYTATELNFDYEETVEGIDLTKHVYIELSSDDQIVIVDDFRTPVCYIQLESDDHLDYLVERLTRWLKPVPFAELEERAQRTRGKDPGALVRLALAAGGHDPSDRACALIREALASSDPKVKNTAIEAASLTRWQTLGADLDELARHDPDPEVRSHAAKARQLLDGAKG